MTTIGRLAPAQARLRVPTAGDAPVIEQVFRLTRAEQFGGALVPPAMLASLLDLQFRAQQTQYRSLHELAVDHVVESSGQPVGRCWIDRSATAIRVLDLAVVPAARRRGVASAVLRDLQDEANAVGMAVRLSVWRQNAPALALYTGLGFTAELERSDGCLELVWHGEGAPA